MKRLITFAILVAMFVMVNSLALMPTIQAQVVANEEKILEQKLKQISDSLNVELNCVPDSVWQYAREYLYRQTMYSISFGGAAELYQIGLPQKICWGYTATLDRSYYGAKLLCPEGNVYVLKNVDLEIHGQFNHDDQVDVLFVILDEETAKDSTFPKGPEDFKLFSCSVPDPTCKNDERTILVKPSGGLTNVLAFQDGNCELLPRR
ncbi:MAG: hypothetical protein WCV85_04240 [Patescibacteria group bacterium]